MATETPRNPDVPRYGAKAMPDAIARARRRRQYRQTLELARRRANEARGVRELVHAARNSSRKLGAAISINRSARSRDEACFSAATPNSVTTRSTSVRSAVTSSTRGTIRDTLPPRAVAVIATIDRPPRDAFAARMKSTEPPVPEICFPPTLSAFTWPSRSISTAELIDTKFGISPNYARLRACDRHRGMPRRGESPTNRAMPRNQAPCR